ncbi:MAG TPA: GEVED domain-containing protein [Flavipsychrobacter sp.]|nr:GEVED domain-containing protein [Flavipsychrobacter sp.]
MTNIYSKLSLTALLLYGSVQASAQLTPACSPSYPSGGTSWRITSFAVNGFSHSPSASVHDYTSQTITLDAGTTYTATAISAGWCSVGVAADFDNNGVLTDAGESLALPGYIAADPATYTLSITVPAYVLTGSYRIRVYSRLANAGNGVPANSPCGTYAYGNWVDYTLSVINNNTCVPPSGVNTANVVHNGVDISWLTSTSNPANYTWKIVNQGNDPALVPGVASGTVAVPFVAASGLSALTSYDAYVQSNCGSAGTSLWSLASGFVTPCNGLPTGGTANVSNAAPCLNQTANYSLTGASSGPGLTYQWEDSLSMSGIWMQVPGATNAASTFALSTGGVHYLRCVVSCGAFSAVSTSAMITMMPFPGGTYTIDNTMPTGGSNFNSFTDAVAAISCGTTSAVTFNVAPFGSPYNEQITLPATIGATASNPIVINGNGNTLTFNGTSSNMHTLGLNGADYITVNNLIIEGTNGTNALVCHLWNGADHNTFNNCTFSAPANGTSLTQVPFSISGSATSGTAVGVSGSYNMVSGCTIFSGYYNAYVVGNTGTGTNIGNKIINSTSADFYLYGIYFRYQDSALISNNTVHRPTRTSLSTFYGIYLSDGCKNSLVERNVVRHPVTGAPSNTSSCYGIYCTATSTVGNENMIYNNLVSDFANNGGNYGIYTTGTHFQAYHNTISLDNAASTAGTTYGIYATGTAGVNIQNNNVSITRGGSGTKYCLYYSGAAGKTSNFNNLYLGSITGTRGIGYFSTAFAALSNWQGANGAVWDANSLSENPGFYDPSTYDYTPTNILLDNAGNALNVSTDLLNAPRNLVTPDLGAYEFNNAPTDIRISSISATNEGNSNRIDWKTFSEDAGDLLILERSLDGRRYTTLETISCKGEARAYTQWDHEAAQGVNYYRLRLASEGDVTYSNVAMATVGAKGFAIVAYPNPVLNTLNVEVSGDKGNHSRIMVMDIAGKIMIAQQLTGNMAQVDMTGMAPGFYMLKYTDNRYSKTIGIHKK